MREGWRVRVILSNGIKGFSAYRDGTLCAIEQRGMSVRGRLSKREGGGMVSTAGGTDETVREISMVGGKEEGLGL